MTNTTTFQPVTVPKVHPAFASVAARIKRAFVHNPTVALIALLPVAVVLSPVVLAFAVVMGAGGVDNIPGACDAEASL